MRIRMSFLKDGELIAEAVADLPGTADQASAGRVTLENVKRFRPGVDLLDESVTCYVDLMGEDSAADKKDGAERGMAPQKH